MGHMGRRGVELGRGKGSTSGMGSKRGFDAVHAKMTACHSLSCNSVQAAPMTARDLAMVECCCACSTWEQQDYCRGKRNVQKYQWRGCRKQLLRMFHMGTTGLKLGGEECGEVPVAWVPKAAAMPRCSAASPRGVEVAWAFT